MWVFDEREIELLKLALWCYEIEECHTKEENMEAINLRKRIESFPKGDIIIKRRL